MKRYGLLGERLGHSLSVPIHRAVFRALGLDAEYRLIELPREEFAARAAALLTELDGFNVTIPYKRDILPLLSAVDPQAAEVGAVNTVSCGPGGAAGSNTDVAGFEASLRAAGISPAGRPCWVLGTGGASLAVRCALRRMGAAQVYRVSRRPSEDTLGYDALPERFSGLLVNTTPVGMYPDTDACPLPPQALDALLLRADAVADVIYNPKETQLLRAARERGLPCCGGLTMLAAQALESERIWQGRSLPDGLLPAVLGELEELLP